MGLNQKQIAMLLGRAISLERLPYPLEKSPSSHQVPRFNGPDLFSFKTVSRGTN